jgi:hypothetical protein
MLAPDFASESESVAEAKDFYPYSDRKPDSYVEATYGFRAAELTGGVMSTVSGPMFSWPTKSANQRNTNYSIPAPQMVTNISMPRSTSSSPQQSVNNSRSPSGTGSYSQAQVLSNLQSALTQLSVVLSTYKAK